MIRYITPNYLLPDNGEIPMRFCGKSQKVITCIYYIVQAATAILVAWTLIDVFILGNVGH